MEFIDSTSIKVCYQLLIPRLAVFKECPTRGKGTMGWFYSFKLTPLLIASVIFREGSYFACYLTNACVRLKSESFVSKISERIKT
ncbi:TPA: transposase [Photobacterium damselae]